MTEMLHRVEIKNIEGKIEVYSAITDINGNMPEENSLIGTFESSKDGNRQISKNKAILSAILTGNAAVGVASWVMAFSACIDELTHVGQAEWDNASLRLVAAGTILLIDKIAGTDTLKKRRVLSNAISALEEADQTAGYPYRKIFPFGETR